MHYLVFKHQIFAIKIASQISRSERTDYIQNLKLVNRPQQLCSFQIESHLKSDFRFSTLCLYLSSAYQAICDFSFTAQPLALQQPRGSRQNRHFCWCSSKCHFQEKLRHLQPKQENLPILKALYPTNRRQCKLLLQN